MKRLILISFVIALLCAGAGTSLAADLGSGPGCSAIENLDATAISNGDTFTGRIGKTAVSGMNKNGKLADDTDGDGLTDSLEECINDALYGHCGDIDSNDSGKIAVTPGSVEGSKQWFTVTFVDNSICGITDCSDHADNDLDLLIDYPNDPQCVNYSDDDESS